MNNIRFLMKRCKITVSKFNMQGNYKLFLNISLIFLKSNVIWEIFKTTLNKQ